MNKQNGLLDSDFILSIRRELHRNTKKDLFIKETTEELLKEKAISSSEKYVVLEAQKEVKKRLYYMSLLDSLWTEIEEIQYTLSKLHTYESLEDEFNKFKNPTQNENIDIDNITLSDYQFSDEITDEHNNHPDYEEIIELEDLDDDNDDPDDEPDIFNDTAYLFDEDDEDDDDDSYEQLARQKQEKFKEKDKEKYKEETKKKKKKDKKKDEKNTEEKDKKKKDKKKKNKKRKEKIKHYEELLSEYRAANERLMLKYLEYKEQKLKKKSEKKKAKKEKKERLLNTITDDSSETSTPREIKKLY